MDKQFYGSAFIFFFQARTILGSKTLTPPQKKERTHLYLENLENSLKKDNYLTFFRRIFDYWMHIFLCDSQTPRFWAIPPAQCYQIEYILNFFTRLYLRNKLALKRRIFYTSVDHMVSLYQDWSYREITPVRINDGCKKSEKRELVQRISTGEKNHLIKSMQSPMFFLFLKIGKD